MGCILAELITLRPLLPGSSEVCYSTALVSNEPLGRKESLIMRNHHAGS